MKLKVWLLVALLALTWTSCKETEEPFYSNNEQDRDDDEITGDDYIYHLPVIFHVLYKDANAVDTNKKKNQYVSYARLQEILKNVNDLYAGNIYKFGRKKDEEVTPSENIHVQFEMALYDENGKKLSTPGVEYIKYTGEYPIDCNNFMKQRKGKNKIIWDPNEYINVMVYNFKQTDDSSTTLGISNMPYYANGYPQIGGLEESKKSNLNKNNVNFEYCVSLNSLYINEESTRYQDEMHGIKGYTYDSRDTNVTLAHELGHFLGLHHVFAETKKGDDTVPAENCDDTDYCTDTKSYNKPAYDKEAAIYIKEHNQATGQLDVWELLKRHNDQGEEWYSDNFMDYAFCLGFRFTPQQRDRMRQVLYYCPLIPGPKKNRNANTQTRSSDDDEISDLPIHLIEDKKPLYKSFSEQ